ncbi:C6 domain-containing protein, partial [Trichostrongylus colubriformis]
MPQLYGILIVLWSAMTMALGCAATSPGTTPTTLRPITRTTTIRPTTTTTLRTTTAVRTTTTTTTPTTAAPVLACQSCTASQVSFDPSNGDPGRIDSDFRLETNDPATGCLRLTAICTAQAGFFSFMEFNVVEGGPAENQNMGQ